VAVTTTAQVPSDPTRARASDAAELGAQDREVLAHHGAQLGLELGGSSHGCGVVGIDGRHAVRDPQVGAVGEQHLDLDDVARRAPPPHRVVAAGVVAEHPADRGA
jgi:hypothetical protein